jgi:hypothetical protein
VQHEKLTEQSTPGGALAGPAGIGAATTALQRNYFTGLLLTGKWLKQIPAS